MNIAKSSTVCYRHYQLIILRLLHHLQSPIASTPILFTTVLHCNRIPSLLVHYCGPSFSRAFNISSYCHNSVTQLQYETVCAETLESLVDYVEIVLEKDSAPPDSDALYSSGVLTIQLGSHGTYVINKQSPNKQIWLSSPTSGPKRYDFISNTWIYKHDGISMHALLSEEFSSIFGEKIDFLNCSYSRKDN